MNAEAQAWFDSRPPEIQALSIEFPPGTVFNVEGEDVYLMGYKGGDGQDVDLLVTTINPALNYDLARAIRAPLCLKHVRDGSVTVERVGVIP